MLPDRSVLIGQKLVENAKIPKLKCEILGDFQTMCFYGFCFLNLTGKDQTANEAVFKAFSVVYYHKFITFLRGFFLYSSGSISRKK